MATYNKSDLQYKHYSWSAIPAGDPRVSGKPDGTPFNREEGHEMLYMINKFLEEWPPLNGFRLELLLLKRLPIHLRSQLQAFMWTQENYMRGVAGEKEIEIDPFQPK
jgi:hypothetical protein